VHARWIVIASGDVTGVGPEVTLDALARQSADDPEGRYLLLGDHDGLERLNRTYRIGIALKPFSGYDAAPGVWVANPHAAPLPRDLSPGAPEAAIAALAWLEDGARRCLRGETQALVTAPLSKEAILRTGRPFVGQTEFLGALSGTEQVVMMLLGCDDRGRWLRVALATTHLPLAEVARRVTREKVDRAIELAAAACRDLQLPQARIGVCGLNPHAGEGGHLGTEEIETIAPAVRACQQRGIDASGPFAADALFRRAYMGEFDALVAQYHDQGLPPLKMVAFDTGVNWTLGLPFPRTSPDHGTAYDIAGRHRARPESMLAAIRLAAQLARRASDPVESSDS